MKLKLLFLLFISFSHVGLTQEDYLVATPIIDEDTIASERFLEIIENSLFEYYNETWGKERAYAVIDSLGYAEGDLPDFSDSVYIARLKLLDKETIIDIEINDDLLKTVKYFVRKRRNFTAICLGRSKLYFPMYEEYLDKYNMPLELKYLSVIESGLRPQVKSRVGAAGLWQFMYRTGRMFGLETDSYVDERMDPVPATDAACRYLKYLYGLYGDWSVALASYNAGPGNVNKAIRRSGGKMNYWQLRPYLPKETRMYVPNFIAMIYMMRYYGEHNILPKKAAVFFHDVDTVCLKSSIRISHVDSLLAINREDFTRLNPVYKTDLIPETVNPQCISLPVTKIPLFFDMEDSLYSLDDYMDSTGSSFVALEKKKTHRVLPNEKIGQIALKYDVTVNDIRGWNNLRSNTIYPGQRLTIRLTERKYIPGSASATKPSSSSSSKPSKPASSSIKTTSDGKNKYYTLKSGESLWTVSKKLGIPFAKLQKLNQGLNPKKLQPGQKIVIGKI